MKLNFNNNKSLDNLNNVVLILNLKSVEEKKVKFTPINITINWIFNHLIFNNNPVIRGYQ